jgi:hypothetical protein
MAYFTHTGTEYTYEALRRHLAEGRLKKLYRKHNFDISRYQELQVRAPLHSLALGTRKERCVEGVCR